MGDITEIHRAALMAERAALEDDARRTRDDRRAVELDQQAVGRLSRMDAMARQQVAEAAERRRQARARAIDAALARIAAGEFGVCTDCGDAIAPRRLDHDPTVMRCIDCARG